MRGEAGDMSSARSRRTWKNCVKELEFSSLSAGDYLNIQAREQTT